MSPWRESVVIGLAPGALQVARLARGFRPRTLERRAFENENGDGSWRAPLETLERMLASSTLAGSACRIVVSNQWSRFLLVPWHDELTSDAARLNLAQAQFSSVYGAAAGGWAVQVERADFGAAALACAIDRELLAALAAAIGDAGLALASVQPHAAVAFNRARRALPAGGCWFAVIEAARVWLGRYERGQWTAIATRRVARPHAEDTIDAIEQELAADTSGSACPLHFSSAGLAPEAADALRAAGYVDVALESEGPLCLGLDPVSAH